MMPILFQLQSPYTGFNPGYDIPSVCATALPSKRALPPEALREEDAALRTAISVDPRLNVLVHCQEVDAQRAFDVLLDICPAPAHVCALPGPLDLPVNGDRPLLIGDVSTLNLHQQIALYDWIESCHASAQVISFTSVPLWPLVTNGRFLEGLFYRLNVMSVSAAVYA